MPNILAIETSSEACSLALSDGKEAVNFHKVIFQQHSEKLLQLINDLMNKLDLSYQDLDVIATGCGPGSFTGTRLACSVTQGLSYSKSIPVISVSSLQIIAQGINREFKSLQVIVLVNAHMGQIYLGNFQFDKENLITASQMALKKEEFGKLDFPSKSVFVGNGCELVKNELDDLNMKVYERYPNAKDLLTEAEKKLSKGEIIDPQDLAPIYLTGEEHWTKK
tara:strand:- start:503 stop:1168 length:666 start_codon:yes stop_codon:yes gene_type:complete